MAAPAGIPRRWTIPDSIETYGIRNWGGQYFAINDAGNVSVTPSGATSTASIDVVGVSTTWYWRQLVSTVIS